MRAEFLELSTPPVLTESIMVDIFGKIPATRNPPKISSEQFDKIKEIAQKIN